MSSFNTILFSTEPLLSTNLKGFYSGNPDLDRFFIRYAGQNQFRHHIGTTYVAIEDDIMKGFVTVSSSSIEIVVYAKPDSLDFEHFTKLKWSSGN